MPARRRTRASASRAGAHHTTAQTTLKDHFQRTTSSSTEKTREIEHPDSLPEAADTQAIAQPSHPRKLFPIFTKVSSVQEGVINIDDIDVTSVSSDAGLSTEPQSSQLTLCSQVTARSIPPSPIALDDDCSEGDTVLQHASTSEHTQGLTKIKKSTLGLAPFPSACSQHVRGMQQSYTCGQAPIKRSTFPSLRTPDEGTLGFLARPLDDTPTTPPFGNCRSLTVEQCEERLRLLCREYAKSHPVFAHVSMDQDEEALRYSETWTRRFRPRRANEVLGNERHALYLRDWLRALELREHPPDEAGDATDKGKRTKRTRRGMKRPRVIREVVRKRRSKRRRVDSSDDELDDFVVWSDMDEEEAEDPDDSEDEITFCQRTLDRLRDRGDVYETGRDRLNGPTTATNHASREAVHAKFADHLTNTVLITGPAGCGKTAAVYACAEELGWDVFEVYPGIGRRNGANLDHLVGDVGKNHMVQTVRKRTGRATTGKEEGLEGYLTGGISILAGTGTRGEPIHVEDERGGVRQSLVLLEEVDVLFKDDCGFWPAVVEFIRGCQRPVVMTCNDAGLVPVDELPLQTVLVFEPCPTRVGASFLAWLATREGWHVEHDELVGLYEATPCLNGEDRGRAEGGVNGDLRRSIMQLQMVLAGGVQGSTTEKQEEDRRSGGAISAEGTDAHLLERTAREVWREMKRESEVMSHVDVCETSKGRGEVVVDEDTVGYVVLRAESHGVHEEAGPRAGLGGRVEAGVLDVLGGLGPSEGVVLDYIPWVRYMAALEGPRRRGRGRG